MMRCGLGGRQRPASSHHASVRAECSIKMLPQRQKQESRSNLHLRSSAPERETGSQNYELEVTLCCEFLCHLKCSLGDGIAALSDSAINCKKKLIMPSFHISQLATFHSKEAKFWKFEPWFCLIFGCHPFLSQSHTQAGDLP